MPELARVVTTDSEIDAAIRQARLCEKYDQRVVRASYSERTDRFLLRLEDGVTHIVPRWLLQGLSEAEPSELNRIELLGRGTGLYWPALDVAHSVSGLLGGVYGSAKWMKHLLESKPTRVLNATAKDSPRSALARGVGGRRRDSDGRIQEKRGDIQVGTLRREYGETFLSGRRSDAKLSTVRKDTDMPLTELVRQRRRGKK